MEIWKDIKDYEGIYQVSNKGRIKSLARQIRYKNGKIINRKEQILKESNLNGYLQVPLSKDGKFTHKYIHRLVAQAFLDNYKEDLEVNHIDFNRSNNNVENLECITKYENTMYSYKSNRIPIPPAQEPKEIICLEDNKHFDSIKDASAYYGINSSLICNQLKGRIKSTHGKVFKYIEEV